MNKKETSWGKVADWYDDLLEKKEDTYQKEVILPNLMRILDPRKGEIILDNACGQGFFSRAIAGAGSTVIGVDIAKELIQIAQRNAVKETTFHASPSDNLSFIKDGSVDKAIIILALQNIEKLNETIIETSRVLKEGGKFLIVLNHPAFRIPKNSSWQWDDVNSKQYRRVDAYMSDIKEKIEMNPGSKNSKKEYTVSFHRPLQVYFKALNKAGFLIGRFEEWISHKQSLKSARGDEENRIRKEIPMFAIIEAIKN